MMATRRRNTAKLDNMDDQNEHEIDKQHFAFTFRNPENDIAETIDDEGGPESAAEENEIDATPGEYILSTATVDALGEKWLDKVNQAFKEDPEANPIWVLLPAMDLLPNAEEAAKTKPTMSGRSEHSHYKMGDEALAALGERFLEVLETFIRLNPKKDPSNALSASAEYIPEKKKNYRGGRKIIGDKPARI
jgi:hypothetical protein